MSKKDLAGTTLYIYQTSLNCTLKMNVMICKYMYLNNVVFKK